MDNVRNISFHSSFVRQQRLLCRITPKEVIEIDFFSWRACPTGYQKFRLFWDEGLTISILSVKTILSPIKTFDAPLVKFAAKCKDSLEFYTDLGKKNSLF